MASTVTSIEPARSRSNWPAGRAVRKFWSEAAPGVLIRQIDDDPDRAWDHWSGYLARRKRPVPLSTLLPGRTSPLAWAMPTATLETETATLIERLHASKDSDDDLAELLEPWLAEADAAPANPPYALACLAWCHALPGLASRIEADSWMRLFDHLVAAARDAAALDVGEQPMEFQWLAGELPLALAYLFPEVKACARSAGNARRALSLGPIEWLDGDGTMRAAELPLLRPLLACWTRSVAMGKNVATLGGRCFNREANSQFKWLISAALRLCRRDGSQMLSSDASGAWCEDLFRAALDVTGSDDDLAVADCILPGRSAERRRSVAKTDLPEPACNSEWAGVCTMRPKWTRGGVRLAVVHDRDQVELELCSGRDVVFSGPWSWDVRVDDRSLRATSSWEQLCDNTDEYGDYLELELELENDWKLQRQIFLARRDGFLYLADVVLGNVSGKIEHKAALPAADVTIEPASETREAFLMGHRARGLVLPLALPEWRIDRRVGSLERLQEGLVLRQSAVASGLVAPLLVDLQSPRMLREPTWRQLTVAQDRNILTPEVAVGYRVQIGSQQWLIYRSLAPPANRTLLGHNLTSEFLVGRFTRRGWVRPLLEIEP